MINDILLLIIERFNRASYDMALYAKLIDYCDSNSLNGNGAVKYNSVTGQTSAADELSSKYASARISYQYYSDLLDGLSSMGFAFYYSSKCGLYDFGNVPLAVSYKVALVDEE